MIVCLINAGYAGEHKPLTPEQVIRKYRLPRDERRSTWVYDTRQYGVMWYGYYSPTGEFHASHRAVNGLADFRSLYPTNYRRFYENQPTAPVRFGGSR